MLVLSTLRRAGLALTVWALVCVSLRAEEESPAADKSQTDMAPIESVEKIAENARDSVVVITVDGRDGGRHGLGSGFIISPDGLVATNMHVIGEARPITVQFADGRTAEVTSIHASDRKLDLAIVRIDAADLPALPLGNAALVKQGQPVVVMGNPHGLQHSVVSGVISGRRELDDREMLQLAIPIEPGNSGGPVLDREGRVLGLVTMKSAVTQNLGFAVPIDVLKPLIDKPNTVPMSKWLTIGALDPNEWTTRFGSRWQQRAGRLFVTQPGKGFGGRSLCLSEADPPEFPYELAVSVRLDDEAGAAGLVFHSDGNNKHYGFYPSAGKLRLTRFEGSNVYTWQVLYNEASEHYRPGQWNHLKVRLEEDKIRCFVNDHLVVESRDGRLEPGKVGLAKFRSTEAEFKHFRVDQEIPNFLLSSDVVERISEQIDKLPALENLTPAQFEPLTSAAPDSVRVLREEAKALEARAKQMRRVAGDVHVHAVAAELARLTRGQAESFDLAKAALLIARIDDDELEVDEYLKQLDRMAAAIAQSLPEAADEPARLAALTTYLFEDNGYHGSRTDYYHRANSHLNRVIDDREGLPITLSVLYMELGRRLGLKIEGVGLPGHFVVRHVPAEGEPQLIDVFDGGKSLSRADAAAKVMAQTGEPLKDEHLEPAAKQSIVRRMLANLLGLAQRSDKPEEMLRYLEAIVAVDPGSVSERGMRAVVRFRTGRRAAALADLDWFLENQPEGLDLEKIRQMREYFLHAQP